MDEKSFVTTITGAERNETTSEQGTKALSGGVKLTRRGTKHFFRVLSFNWTLLVSLFTILFMLVGYFFFGVSPLKSFQEQSYKRLMVNRHLKLGSSFLSVDQSDAAESEFKYALELEPNNKDADFGLLKSRIFKPIKEKEYDPEIVEMRLRHLLIDGADAHVYAYLGDVFSSINLDSAKIYYKKALDMDSTVAHAYHGLGYALFLEQHHNEALANYIKAVKLSKWNQTYLNNLGAQYYEVGKYKDAIAKYKNLLQLNDAFLLSYLSLIKSCLRLGQLDSAYYFKQAACTLFERQDVVSMKANQGYWSFTAEKGTISLIDSSSKRYYAFVTFAEVDFLQSKKQETQRLIAKAFNLRIVQETEALIQSILFNDLNILIRAQPGFVEKLDEFVKLYKTSWQRSNSTN